MKNGGIVFFPQQRKLRPRIAPVCTGAGAGSGSTRFRRRFRKVLEKVWEALVHSQVKFNRLPEKVPEKVPGSLGAKPSQVQQGSGEGSGRFRRRSGRLWCTARSSSTGFRKRFRRRFQEALVQSQVRFNRVPEKVPGGFDAEPGQVQQAWDGTWTARSWLGKERITWDPFLTCAYMQCWGTKRSRFPALWRTSGLLLTSRTGPESNISIEKALSEVYFDVWSTSRRIQVTFRAIDSLPRQIFW